MSSEVPFISFVLSLPREDRSSLIGNAPSALFLFRLLSSSAQSLLLSLICRANLTSGSEYKHDEEAMETNEEVIPLLSSLDLISIENSRNVVNDSFRRAYLRSAVAGAHRCARLKPVVAEKKKKKDKEIGKKSAERWECVLRYLALPSESNTANVSQTTREVFRSAEFTTREGDMDITSAGFQFLLLSPVKQIWTYVIELLRLEMKEGRSVGELLDVLLRIALCIDGDPERRAFEVDSAWNERQINFLMHLRELGLIFMRKRKDGIFFLTSLMANISVGDDSEEVSRKGGCIVVETNYRVYAYTSSSLQLAILSSFTQMTYRFHDMSVGVLTRDSVRQALQVGITADQIISFLRANSHPQAAAKQFPIPVTVADQIRLWEDERKRLKFTDATLYSGFDTLQEYHDVSKFAEEQEIMLFSDDVRKCVVVKGEGHDAVRAWWRERTDRQQHNK